MKKKHLQTILFAFSIIFLSSCNKTLKSELDYLKWLEDTSNGLVIQKEINGFHLKMKYLPTEWLAYQDYKQLKRIGATSRKQDLINLYDSSYVFLFTISNDQDKDIMYYKVQTIEDLKTNVLDMNFNLQDYIWISINGQEIFPTLLHMEGTSEIKNSKTFYIVFSNSQDTSDLFNISAIDIVFKDVFFNTGITHYKFQKDNLNEIPKIGFWQ